MVTFSPGEVLLASKLNAVSTQAFRALTGADVTVQQTGAGAVTRTAQDKLRDVINVRDYGATGNGVTDDRQAFLDAIASIPPGGSAPIYVPPGVWNITGQITTTDRAPVFLIDPGASFIQTNLNFTFQQPIRIERWVGRAKRSQNFSATPDRTMSAMHEYVDLRNTGTTAGYGWRWDYSSNAVSAGFDIAHGVICSWDRTAGQDGGSGLAQWLVARSPQVGGADTRWAVFCTEMNAVNRHADHGWSKRRGVLPNWVVIAQFVPEASTLGSPGVAYDILAGAMFSRSSSNKASDGKPARMHNGILLEPDSITPAGRFIYASGRTTLLAEADTPVAAFEIDDWWQRGFSTRRATLTTGVAYGLGASHALAWLDSNDAATNGIYSGTGSPVGVVMAGVGSIYLRRDGGAGTTLYVMEATGWVGK